MREANFLAIDHCQQARCAWLPPDDSYMGRQVRISQAEDEYPQENTTRRVRDLRGLADFLSSCLSQSQKQPTSRRTFMTTVTTTATGRDFADWRDLQ
jgi:hypothetical protein